MTRDKEQGEVGNEGEMEVTRARRSTGGEAN